METTRVCWGYIGIASLDSSVNVLYSRGKGKLTPNWEG